METCLAKRICKNCGCLDTVLIQKGVRDNSFVDVYSCKNCGLVFLSDFSHIDENFYQNGKMVENIDLETWLTATKLDDLRRYNLLKSQIKNKNICDFGCGNGGFLRLIKNSCSQSCGIELQQNFYEQFKSVGLEVYPDIKIVNKKFDIITMFHVLEHLKSPVDELKEISNYLSEKGRIIIEVPNSNDALLSLYKSKSFAEFTYWSCHLFLYNSKNIKDILQKAGLKVVKIKHIQRYGLVNHLHWLFKNKPAGHKVWAKYDYRPINIVYSFVLSLLFATDTLWVEVKKK